MTIPFIDVAVIGGGPGGLALAHGLCKSNMKVAVFERDSVRADYVQGFRLRVRQRAIDVVQRNLPTHLFEAFLATVGKAPAKRLTLDENFNCIENPETRRESEDAHDDKSVSRTTLRQILPGDLDGIFRPSCHFERYTIESDGTVISYFVDGSAVRSNVLVGADGIYSTDRQQLLPEFRIFDTGVHRLAGKIRMERAVRLGISPILLEYGVSVRASTGHSMMITSHRVDPEAYARYGLIGANDPGHRHIDGVTSTIRAVMCGGTRPGRRVNQGRTARWSRLMALG